MKGLNFILPLLFLIFLLPTSHTKKRHNFDRSLFFALVKNSPDKNIICSPICVYLALAVLYMGAQGATAMELETTLSLPLGRKQDIARDIMRTIEYPTQGKGSTGYLSIISRLYLQKDVPVYRRFTKLIRLLNADVVYIDFKNEKHAAEHVKVWIGNNTKHKIKDSDIRKRGNSAIMVTTMHVSLTWMIPFSPIRQKFSISNTKQMVMNMWTTTRFMKHKSFDGLGCHMVNLILQYTHLSLVLIVPHKVNGLLELENKLNHLELIKLVGKLSESLVHLTFPRMKFESSMSLKNLLADMDINNIFGNPNLTSLTRENETLKISDIIQKTVLDLTQNKTIEATGNVNLYSFMRSELNEPIEVNINRPFIFALISMKNTYMYGHITGIDDHGNEEEEIIEAEPEAE